MVWKSDAFYETLRTPVRRSLGPHYQGFSLPVPDLSYAPDQVAGAIKRVAAQMPEINRVKLRAFRRFVRKWCFKNLSGLQFDANESFDFDEWIESTSYPLYRKNELRDVYVRSLCRKMKTEVLSFVKDENYPEFKHVRGIYSRHDDFKVRVGPFFKKVGDIFFNLKWFIKKIPVHLRPSAMLDKFGDCSNIFCTDFSQYEATFVKKLMSVENIVYGFLLKNNPNKKRIMDDISRGMMSTNFIQFRKWAMELCCKRMSGEMNTSVSNGFMNLLLTHFLLKKAGNNNFDSYIEGDDSISSYDVRPPRIEEYEEMGARIKIEKPLSLCQASFCGQIFDPIDLDNVSNPMEAIVSFGWTGRDYMYSNDLTLRKLLKAKSLSLLYEYSGCPVIRSVAMYGLRVTNDIPINDVVKIKNKSRMSSYEREKYLMMLDNFDENKCFGNYVKNNTRVLVSEMYNFPIELQFLVEDYFDKKNDLKPIYIPEIEHLFHKDWSTYYQMYAIELDFKPKRPGQLPDFNVSINSLCKYYINPRRVEYV